MLRDATLDDLPLLGPIEAAGDARFAAAGHPELADGSTIPLDVARRSIAEERLIVADVGQNDYEELSFVARGDNMGWNTMEGFHCFKPRKNCNQSGLKPPFYEYDHGVGQSILGGYVYEGTALPQVRNKYIFADSVAGRIFAIDYQSASAKADVLIQAPGLYSSFGRLRNRELVIAELMSGKIYLLSPTGTVGAPQ
mgnify:CR=1 FL=1